MKGVFMKGAFCFIAVLLCGAAACADVTVFRGESREARDIVCVFDKTRVFPGGERAKPLFTILGNMVYPGGKVSRGRAVFRLQNGRIFRGTGDLTKDCLATILESQIRKDGIAEARIFRGYVAAKNVKKRRSASNRGTVQVEYKLIDRGGKYIDGEVLFTVSNSRIYRGDSTDAEACVLSYSGDLSAHQLLLLTLVILK